MEGAGVRRALLGQQPLQVGPCEVHEGAESILQMRIKVQKDKETKCVSLRRASDLGLGEPKASQGA